MVETDAVKCGKHWFFGNLIGKTEYLEVALRLQIQLQVETNSE